MYKTSWGRNPQKTPQNYTNVRHAKIPEGTKISAETLDFTKVQKTVNPFS